MSAPIPEPYTLEHLLEIIHTRYPAGTDTSMVELAYEFARDAHGDQYRISGEPYIVHPTAAAIKLATMNVEIPVIVAALLHDVPEDTERTFEDIRREFGDDVAEMVAGVTKLGKVQYRGLDRYTENLRKMFYAMASDVRTIFIKFADRLHNMLTLDAIPEPKRRRIAKEVLEIYAPIANRLGMGEFKGQFEDLAFRYVYPEEYQRVKRLREQNLKMREKNLEKTIKRISQDLAAESITPIEIHGRVKRLYSLYQKLARYDNDVTRIYDLVAIRVILPKVADCYSALGIIHRNWKPLKGRIKDYIAQPKPNGYQSLHSTIFGEGGYIMELQIRTLEMHESAEYGIPAHWRYKDDNLQEKKNMRWLKELVRVQEDLKDKEEFFEHLEEVKLDAFSDRIFVFTPKGDAINLSKGATPVDFAYAIHTEIGNKCVASWVNDKIVNLDTELKSGDICDIVIDKNRKGPNPDWLLFVKSRHARDKIKDATRHTMRGWFMGRRDVHSRRKRVRENRTP